MRRSKHKLLTVVIALLRGGGRIPGACRRRGHGRGLRIGGHGLAAMAHAPRYTLHALRLVL